MLCFKLKMIPVLEGRPGIGKTKITSALRFIEPYTKREKSENCVRILSMNKDMNENGIFGNFKILNRNFCYEDGILKDCMVKGNIFLAD